VCLPFGRNLTDRMKTLLGPTADPPGEIRVHLPSLATGPIFARLGPLFTPRQMTADRSCLVKAGPLHRKLHLVDDGARPGALRTRLFDGRGVHAVPLTLIKDGAVDRVFLDPPTARSQGTRPTGHTRDGKLQPTNLLIRPGTRTANAILTELGQTVFEVSIFPEDFDFNPATGAFSAIVSGRIRVGGKHQLPVRNVLLKGNLVEALKSVFDITSNTDRIGHVDAPGFIVDTFTVG
jgi:predicted Zn-dependent protease